MRHGKSIKIYNGKVNTEQRLPTNRRDIVMKCMDLANNTKQSTSKLLNLGRPEGQNPGLVSLHQPDRNLSSISLKRKGY